MSIKEYLCDMSIISVRGWLLLAVLMQASCTSQGGQSLSIIKSEFNSPMPTAMQPSTPDLQVVPNEIAKLQAQLKTQQTHLDKQQTRLAEQQVYIEDIQVSQQAKMDALLAKQQNQLDHLLLEQQQQQEQLRRLKLNLIISPQDNLNAGRGNQAMASTVYLAPIKLATDFIETKDLATKELVIIPKRELSLSLPLTEEDRFIAIKIDLRYTKKRSQFLIPLTSIDFDEPLHINIGACDANIEAGLLVTATPAFTDNLQRYQQPLITC